MKMFRMGLWVGVLAVATMGSARALAKGPAGQEHALIAYMKVQPGTEAQFLKAAEDVIKDSREEAGNIIYELHQSTINPQQFVFYELFKTNADLQFHRNAKHVKDFLRETKDFTVEFILEEYELRSRLE